MDTSLPDALPTILGDFLGASWSPCRSAELNTEHAGHKARLGQKVLVRKETFQVSLSHSPQWLRTMRGAALLVCSVI